jgi:hypothetical protein
LARLGSTYFTRKNGDILLVQNSPGTRLTACVIFFGCETRLHLFTRNLLTEDIHLEDDLEDLGDPVGEEDDEKASEGAGDHFFAFFLGLFVGGTREHGESSEYQHAKEDEARNSHDGGEKTVDDATEAVAGCDTNGAIIITIGDILGKYFIYQHIIILQTPVVE